MAPGESPPQSASTAAVEPPLGTRIARGTLIQQVALAVAVLAGFVTTTVLARSLSLAEFGVYGFVVALASYLYFVIQTAETAAVNEMALAGDHDALELAFTRSVLIYGGLGVAAGIVIGIGGALLVSVLGFSLRLTHQAQIGAVAIGLLTAIGWAVKVFQDYLRAIHRFTEASISEATGSVLLCATITAAVGLGAPLWVLIAAGGSFPLYVGLTAFAFATARGVRCRLRPREVHVSELRSLLGFSSGLLVISSSDFVVNSLDRTIVGVLRSAATLGLYEAAAKLNGLIRMWVANLNVTMLPVLSRMHTEGDRDRERTMLLMGTRYMLVATVGPTVALMVLCDRLLAVWLGVRYVAAAPTAVIFLAVWLVSPNLSIASTMTIVSRRLRQLGIAAWVGAAINLALSIALTAWLGVVGVAIGTFVAYIALIPYFASFALAGRGVTAADFTRVVWTPAYGLGLVLAAGLLAVRLVVPLDHLWSVLAVLVVAVVAYWGGFYLLATDPEERAMLRSVFGR